MYYDHFGTILDQEQERPKRTHQEYLRRGVLRGRIDAYLAQWQAASVEELAATFGSRMPHPNIKTAVSYQIGKMVSEGVVDRLARDVYVKPGHLPTWRRMLSGYRPDLFLIAEVLGGDWATADDIVLLMWTKHKVRGDKRKVLADLRAMKALGIVWKSGRSDWRLCVSLDDAVTMPGKKKVTW